MVDKHCVSTVPFLVLPISLPPVSADSCTADPAALPAGPAGHLTCPLASSGASSVQQCCLHSAHVACCLHLMCCSFLLMLSRLLPTGVDCVGTRLLLNGQQPSGALASTQCGRWGVAPAHGMAGWLAVLREGWRRLAVTGCCRRQRQVWMPCLSVNSTHVVLRH